MRHTVPKSVVVVRGVVVVGGVVVAGVVGVVRVVVVVKVVVVAGGAVVVGIVVVVVVVGVEELASEVVVIAGSKNILRFVKVLIQFNKLQSPIISVSEVLIDPKVLTRTIFTLCKIRATKKPSFIIICLTNIVACNATDIIRSCAITTFQATL